MNTHLCNTTLTGQKLWSFLNQSGKIDVNGHQIQEVEANVVGAGQGFTSKVLRVQLKWSQLADHLPNSVIVKIIGSNAWELFATDYSEEAKEKHKRDLRQAHNVECRVYDFKGLDKVVPMPACYGKIPCVDDTPGMIVLEDLSHRGHVMPPCSMFLGFDTLEKFNSVLEALASTHAWSVNNTNWRKDMVTLKELHVLEPNIQSFPESFSTSKVLYPDLFKNLDEAKLFEFVNVKRFVEIFGDDPKVRYNLPSVLVHGDIHAINMMFEKTTDNKAGDKLIALLDWQLAHKGCAMEDLTILIIACAPTDVKMEKLDEILETYVQLFNSKINNSIDHIKYQDVKRAFNEMFSFLAMFWACCVGVVEKMSQRMKFEDDEKREEYKRKVLIDRINLYQEACKMLNW